MKLADRLPALSQFLGFLNRMAWLCCEMLATTLFSFPSPLVGEGGAHKAPPALAAGVGNARDLPHKGRGRNRT